MYFLALFHTAIPIQPPPLRGTSFHRKEGVSTRAPSFGRGCRAQRGGVGFLFRRRSGALVNDALETIFFALFHTARTLSGSLRSPPSPHGEGFIRPYCFSTHACIRSDDMGIAVLSYRSLPHLGKLCWGHGILVSSSIPRKNDRLLRAVVFMCITCLRKRRLNHRIRFNQRFPRTPLPSSSPYRRRSKGSGRGSGHTP